MKCSVCRKVQAIMSAMGCKNKPLPHSDPDCGDGRIDPLDENLYEDLHDPYDDHGQPVIIQHGTGPKYILWPEDADEDWFDWDDGLDVGPEDEYDDWIDYEEVDDPIDEADEFCWIEY